MPQINDNYLKLKAGYLFPEIGRRVKAFAAANPAAKVIRMGIGDVTEPLVPAVIQAMHKAVDEMADRATFKGYGDEQGYGFLREAVAKHDFQARNCDVAADEVFISDGSKCDTGNILDILGHGKNKIAITRPGLSRLRRYQRHGRATPARLNDRGAAYGKLVYRPDDRPSNGFTPASPAGKKPTWTSFTSARPTTPPAPPPPVTQLEAWVKYALEHKAVILFDAAYEAYISDPALPHSIYEIPGARECAIEFRSLLSKTRRLHRRALRVHRRAQDRSTAQTKDGGEFKPLHPLWNRRHDAPSSTASPTSPRPAQPPSTSPRAASRSTPSSPTT